MDAHRFDTLTRALLAARSRRTVLGLAASGLFGATTAQAKPKGKGKKGKGCGKGKKKCGNKCIPKSNCCDGEPCTGCRNESCVNGTCQCPPELILHNGVCGFFLDCKGIGQVCTSHEQCCSGSCSIDAGEGQMRCAKSTTRCLIDIDCLSGPCRGYSCPESLAPYLSSCQ